MSELLTVPFNLIGNWQLSPGATVRSPVEFSPQSASVTDIGQSGAAHAKDTDATLAGPRISTKAPTLDIRIVAILILTQTTLTKVPQAIWAPVLTVRSDHPHAALYPPCPVRASRSSVRHPVAGAAAPSPHPTVRASRRRAPRRSARRAFMSTRPGLAATTDHFSSRALAWRSTRAPDGPTPIFAWGCFRDFVRPTLHQARGRLFARKRYGIFSSTGSRCFRNVCGSSLIGKWPSPFMMVTSQPGMLLATASVSSGVQE
jgi:hypothetical protein